MNVDLVAVGSRVRAARQRAGLTQRDVTSRTGISQPTLQRVEKGERTRASLADFDQLAQALSMGLDDLLYGSAVRERVLAGARTAGSAEGGLQAALGKAIELLELDARLDAVIPNLRQEATNLAPAIPPEGSPSERAQEVAGQVREALGLGAAPIADLVEVTELLTGVDVGIMPLPSGVSGICATDPDRATSIALVNSDDVAERQRFTLAHELGHLLAGHTTHVDAVDGRRTPEEMFCDEFARDLLIPVDGVHAWLGRTVGIADPERVSERVLALMARHFKVSPVVVRIQLERMGLLPDALKGVDLPSGRLCAYRYGWGPQYDSDQDAAKQPRVPRRILDRATEAYRAGKLGIGALAKLQSRPTAEVEQALADAGATVVAEVRRADVSALVARASERRSLAGQSAS